MRTKTVFVGFVALSLTIAACGSESDGDATETDQTAPAVESIDSGPDVGAPSSDVPTGGETLSVDPDVSGLDAYKGPVLELPTTFGEPTAADLTIGFLQPLGASETVATLQRTVELEVERLGGTTISLDALADPDLQVTQMEQLIDQGVDAIIVWPLDSRVLVASTQRAQEAGIPVIAMESNPVDFEDLRGFDAQVVFGRDLEAFIHAYEMAKLNPGGKVGTIGFVLPVESLEAYVQLTTAYAEQFGLEVVDRANDPSGDPAGGEIAGNELLTANPDLTGVFAYNDPSATGAGTAARAANRDIFTFGVDGESIGFESIRSGRQTLTIQVAIVEMGQELVAAAYILVQNPDADLPPSVFPKMPVVVTAENVDIVATWDDQLAEEYGA